MLYRDAQCGSFCVKGGKVQLRLRWCMITAGGKYVVSTSSVYLRVFYAHPYPTSTEYRWFAGKHAVKKKKMPSMCEMPTRELASLGAGGARTGSNFPTFGRSEQSMHTRSRHSHSSPLARYAKIVACRHLLSHQEDRTKPTDHQQLYA